MGDKSSEIICFRFESLVRVLISWPEWNYKCRISVLEETSMEKLKHKVIVMCISLMGFVSFQIIIYMSYLWNFEHREWKLLRYMSKEWDRDKKWSQRSTKHIRWGQRIKTVCRGGLKGNDWGCGNRQKRLWKGKLKEENLSAEKAEKGTAQLNTKTKRWSIVKQVSKCMTTGTWEKWKSSKVQSRRGTISRA